ncbi:MAG: GNAT family N-acetyltransferase [Tepidisphaeraceae bacterium]|jgi:CelD/BcsL family acetyltransferase involved in cellulose biosynthesis
MFQLAGRMRGALRALIPAALNIAGNNRDFDPLERNGLCARCLRDWPDDPDFLPRWNELLARNPWATVFLCPAWQSAAVNEFVSAGQFRLITVSRQQQLLAVLPLALNASSMLETPGGCVTDYLDPLVDSQAGPECWEIILRLLDELWDWSMGGVLLHQIHGDSPLRQILPGLASNFGFEYSETLADKAPYIMLPKSWDDYLASLDSHERKEIKRKIHNARTKAHLQWLTIQREEELVPALDRALAAMRQSESCKADFTDEVLVGFLRRLCPILARQGDFFLQELWLEGKPSAWLLCLRSDRGPMIYNTGYELSQRRWSPGIVSFSLAIQDAIAAGSPVFNLLRGTEEYKKRFGAQDLDLFDIQLLPR